MECLLHSPRQKIVFYQTNNNISFLLCAASSFIWTQCRQNKQQTRIFMIRSRSNGRGRDTLCMCMNVNSRRPMLVSLVVHMRHALSIYVCEVRDDHSSSSSRMRQLLPPRITSILLRSARALHHRCMCVCSLFLIVRPGAFGSTQSTHTNNYTCK